MLDLSIALGWQRLFLEERAHYRALHFVWSLHGCFHGYASQKWRKGPGSHGNSWEKKYCLRHVFLVLHLWDWLHSRVLCEFTQVPVEARSFTNSNMQLPIWLQTIQNYSVISSAVKLLPIIGAAVVFTTLAGILTPVVGYYVPFMIIATTFLSICMGLLSTLDAETPIRYVLGYQVLGGIGLGCALQQTLVAAQTILPMKDIPIGVSLIVLAQTLGGTIALSAADAIYAGSLASSISNRFPEIDSSTVLNAGQGEIRHLVPAQDLGTVIDFTNDSIRKTWYLSAGLAAASIIGVLGMEWKRVAAPPKK